MNDITIAAETFHAGEFLKEELESRGWSQAELAEIIGRPTQAISEIVLGKRGVTPETAKGLAAAFGTSAEYWMNLETAYQLSKATIQEVAVRQRAKLYAKFPVKQIVKRGWIEYSENSVVLEQRFLEFFGISEIDETPRCSYAGKKQNYSSSSLMQIAWVKRVEQLATIVHAKKYDKSKLQELFAELRNRRQFVDSIREIPALLANYGIRFVIVEPIPGMKMTGVCTWLDKNSPVIGLALTYDRIDNFWFTLFHELDHIEHEEGQGTPILDDLAPNKNDAGEPEIEKRANVRASQECVEDKEIAGFIARVNPLFTLEQIKGFAKRLGIHPGIVVGQLHGRGSFHYSLHRSVLEKIRGHIVGVALTDGYGSRLQV